MTPGITQTISEEQIHSLSNYLDEFEEAHNYAASHGFLCAMAILPNPYSSLDLLGGLLDEEPEFTDDSEQQSLLESISSLNSHMDTSLSAGEAIALPVGPFIEDKTVNEHMVDWCIGFMDAVFVHEDDWYGTQEELVTELLLPMACISDVFDDKELRQLISNPKKAKQMCEQIPQVMIDLYLLFRQQ